MDTPAKEIQLRGDSVLQLPFTPPQSLYGAKLEDIVDVDTTETADGSVLTRQPDGSFAMEELPAGLGAPEWGDLVGTLADQIDLQAALNGKAATSHSHAIADTTGLQGALDGKAATSHTHATSEVTGLDTVLAGKAATAHGHAIVDTTGLQAALDGKAAASHTHSTSQVTGLDAALAGKAATSHSHAIADTTGLQVALDGKAAGTHTHTTSQVTGLDAALAGKAAATHGHTITDTSGLQAALDAKAAHASPAFSGTPTVPTAAAATNNTQAASTAFANAAVRAAATPGLRASRYYSSFAAPVVTTFTITANRLYFMPFFCPDFATWTRIGINVTTVGAGLARLGIYGNANGIPSGAPLLDAGTVDVSTTGEKEIVISHVMTPGWYWLAMVSDVAFALTAENISGATLLCNVGSTSGGGANIVHIQQTFTFAALPTPSGISAVGTTTPLRIWLRL